MRTENPLEGLMKKAAGFVLMALIPGACGTTDFGDRLQTQGAAISSLGKQWENGEAMTKRGNALIEKGHKRIAEGGEMIADGTDLVERGTALKAESEAVYRQQK